jgi:hypothetical protein
MKLRQVVGGLTLAGAVGAAAMGVGAGVATADPASAPQAPGLHDPYRAGCAES